MSAGNDCEDCGDGDSKAGGDRSGSGGGGSEVELSGIEGNIEFMSARDCPNPPQMPADWMGVGSMSEDLSECCCCDEDDVEEEESSERSTSSTTSRPYRPEEEGVRLSGVDGLGWVGFIGPIDDEAAAAGVGPPAAGAVVVEL